MASSFRPRVTAPNWLSTRQQQLNRPASAAERTAYILLTRLESASPFLSASHPRLVTPAIASSLAAHTVGIIKSTRERFWMFATASEWTTALDVFLANDIPFVCTSQLAHSISTVQPDGRSYVTQSEKMQNTLKRFNSEGGESIWYIRDFDWMIEETTTRR